MEVIATLFLLILLFGLLLEVERLHGQVRALSEAIRNDRTPYLQLLREKDEQIRRLAEVAYVYRIIQSANHEQLGREIQKAAEAELRHMIAEENGSKEQT